MKKIKNGGLEMAYQQCCICGKKFGYSVVEKSEDYYSFMGQTNKCPICNGKLCRVSGIDLEDTEFIESIDEKIL